VKPSLTACYLAVPIVAILCACSHDKPPAEAPRPVRTVELRYDKAAEANRYVATVQARHEVDQAFRVAGKVAERKVEVGQKVREGEVLAVLDASDYRLAEEAARQQLAAATAQAHQAQLDRQRLSALKVDGSVSASDEEQAQSRALTTQATAEAQAKQLELARNRLVYTVLRASRSGVVTSRKFEVGQVVAEGQPVVSIADEGEPEIVIDVPEDQLAGFNKARFKASLPSESSEAFEVVLRELSPQAAAQTRTYRARLKPVRPTHLPLGATATLIAEYPAEDTPVASIPAGAITQSNGQPALWVVRPAGSERVGAVDLIRVNVHGYRNDQVLVSGPPPGALIVTAGVQKMAPGLHVALQEPARTETTKQATR
jgi:membrane fusion protein, multidrug efflux system